MTAGLSASSTTNTLDIIASTEGAGLRISGAASGAAARVGAIRLGRGANAVTNTYLVNDTGTFKIFNGVGTTGTEIAAFSSGNVTVTGTVTSGGYIATSSAINPQINSYTLTSSDNGKIITMNSSSGITLTVPNSLDVGFSTTIIRLGAGNVGISAGGTVNINSFQNQRNIAGQHAAVSLISYITDTYNLAGGLTG
jgi:hypothetical protein